ncbi:MAG: tetratricopeptide repeat protein [Phycisphaerae bacterium]|nr:tetratricopeptide repeat protein [Phycisphaerae bacterium]
MEDMVQSQVDLFSENIPSLEDITQLSAYVNSSENARNAFSNQVEEKLSAKDKKTLLSTGLGLCILAKYSDAIEKLEKAPDCVQKFVYLSFALRSEGNFDSAIKNLDKAQSAGAAGEFVGLQKAATYRLAKDSDKASAELESLKSLENLNAEYHYQLGRVNEFLGEYKAAKKNYLKAVELDPDNQQALFHLACRYDMEGNESAAIDYYKRIVSENPVYVNALLNLAVLYEDAIKYDLASKCIEKVLKFHPNHKRALLFKKDVESSKTMFYDEEKEIKKTRTNKILETPISDFELSVRSRNCLRKMKMNTVGDLLNITEAELLSYKNFGETSLTEIKEILESKGLRLGMAVESGGDFGISPIEQTVEEGENSELLSKPVEDLQLSVRARKCIEKLNLRTIGELVKRTEAELLGCKNFGVTSLNEIKAALTNFGLSLRTLDH